MANGDSTPDVSTILSDPNFKSLDIGEKHKVMMKVDPNYAGLPPREQAHAIGVIQWGPTAEPEDLGQGPQWIRDAYGIGRGLNNAVEATYQTIIHPIDTASAIASQIEDFPGKVKEASKQPGAVGKAADIGAAVPVLGPVGKMLGERAGKGDIGGAIAEGLTTAIAPLLAKEGARKLPISDLRRATIEAPEKISLPGGFKINRNTPPPPPTPEEITYKTGKAQVEAQAENVKQTAKAAKVREAGFNKEAGEHAAIQKRFDDAQEARAQAEKEVKNAKFKADQTHAKELADAEKARQGEITAQAKVRHIQEQMEAAEKAKDAKAVESLKVQEKQAVKDANDAAAQKERLRNDHAKSLMDRQRDQDRLDKAAKKAGDDESTAKREVGKLPPAGGGGSPSARPSVTEEFATNLAKKAIWTPEDVEYARKIWGEDANIKIGEGQAHYRARLLGMVRSGRAAIGMSETESGPSTRGIPPPPSTTPGGSGESSASAEAINRTRSESRGGVKYFIEDTRSKQRIPVSSIDANGDMRLGPFKRIIQSGPNGESVFR